MNITFKRHELKYFMDYKLFFQTKRGCAKPAFSSVTVDVIGFSWIPLEFSQTEPEAIKFANGLPSSGVCV